VAIRIAPGTEAWRLLELVGEADGQRSAEDLAARLRPWVAAPIPPGPGALEARRAARAAWQREARARTARLLGRLVEAGLVEPRGDRVELWPEAAAAWCRAGAASLEVVELAERGGELVQTRRAPGRHAVAIVEALAAGGRRYAELVEATGGGGGAWSEAYAGLVEAGVVRPPGFRTLTGAGRRVLGRESVPTGAPAAYASAGP
jgi:hypothetical protein